MVEVNVLCGEMFGYKRVYWMESNKTRIGRQSININVKYVWQNFELDVNVYL